MVKQSLPLRTSVLLYPQWIPVRMTAVRSKRRAYTGQKARIQMLDLGCENIYLLKIKKKLLKWAAPGGRALGKRSQKQLRTVLSPTIWTQKKFNSSKTLVSNVNSTCQWRNMGILMTEKTLKIRYLAILSHYNILISYRTTHSTDNCKVLCHIQ